MKSVFFLFPFFKNGSDISLLPVTGDFSWQPWLFRYDGEWFGHHNSQFLQDPGRHVIGLHRLEHTQSHEAVSGRSALTLWGILLSPISARRFKDMTDEGSNCQLTLRQITCWASQPSPCLLKPVLPFYLSKTFARTFSSVQTFVLYSVYLSH